MKLAYEGRGRGETCQTKEFRRSRTTSSAYLMMPCFFSALLCFWMDVSQLPAFEALLPVYYNHCKFSSFSRQLNYYGKVDLSLFALVPCGLADR